MNIVIADDSRTQRDQLLAALVGAGHDVVAFDDGAPALASIRASQPDLVILDVVMNGMTGIEVYEALKKDGNPVPIIFATSMGQKGAAKRPDLKPDGIIMKPFMLPDLILGVVEEVMDARSQ